MNEMRRKDRMTSKEEALEILNKGEYGILSTVDSDGQPYGVPVNYVVIKNENIYYHSTNAGGAKHDNIVKNSNVSFTVVGNTKLMPEKFGTLYESVIVFGKAQEVFEEEERMLAFREFLNKYSPDFIEEGEKHIKDAGPRAMIVKISINSISGKGRKK